MIQQKYNADIYSLQSIENARKDYRDIAKIHVQEIEGYIEVSFYNCKYSEELTAREFENYVIGMENI